MSIRKAVFPVAGMGTRLLPATKSQPKEMLPVGYKPVVQYVVEEMIEQGLSKFLFITGRKKRSIEDHFDADPELEARLSHKEQVIDEFDYASKGVDFYYARQRRPAGNADAVRLAREFVGHESFVVAFGDTIIYSPHQPRVIERMIESHERHGSVATIGVWEVPLEDTKKYGVVRPAGEISDDFPISDIVEKPAIEDTPSCCAVAARYIFTPEIFDAIDAIKPGLGGELWLTDAIRILLEQGAPIRCVRLNDKEQRYDIGTPLTYYKAFTDFDLQDPEHGAAFRAYLNEKLSKER
jgi:UTP--glucose-1-phosphate uridylyltransferase